MECMYQAVKIFKNLEGIHLSNSLVGREEGGSEVCVGVLIKDSG